MTKMSHLVESQLPEYIRSDAAYEKFILFLQAYYDWLELNQKSNITEYVDIDHTLDEFITYFLRDFTPHIPESAIADKRKLVKIAKELYKTKGTPNSYQFLFRALYGIDVDVFETSSSVFKASSGKWSVPKSLKVKSVDVSWLKTSNYTLFGESSKSSAVIERARLISNKVELFISDIEVLFLAGEMVRVVDNLKRDVIIDGKVLRAKLIGQLSSIKVNPKFRGELYETGDPVVVTGGLNPFVENPIAATAIVDKVTIGSIQDVIINVNANTGFGFSPQEGVWEESIPTVIYNGQVDNNALLKVGIVDESTPGSTVVVGEVVTDTILSKLEIPLNGEYNFYRTQGLEIPSNINSRLCDVFTFSEFVTGKLQYIDVKNGGGGYKKTPKIKVDTYYRTDISDYTPPYIWNESLENGSLKRLGILSPITIVKGGSGYRVGDHISFLGGCGVGANAAVTSVDTSGAILSVEYTSSNCSDSVFREYPKGGAGYKNLMSNGKSGLPKIVVDSSTGSGANLAVYSVLADGIDYTVVTDRIGSVSTIKLLEHGEDYISTPNVSLRTMIISCPTKNANLSLDTTTSFYGNELFQGESREKATFVGKLNKLSYIQDEDTPYYELLVYDYSTPKIDESIPLKLITKANVDYVTINVEKRYEIPTSIDGIFETKAYKVYGNGLAKANAIFLNGLVIGEGSYLDQSGHPSSFSILQDDTFNNYTYILTAEKSLKQYKDAVLSLLHPLGTKMIGRNKLYSSNMIKSNTGSMYSNVISLITLAANTNANIIISSNSYYSNTIQTSNCQSNAFMIGDIITFNSLGVSVKSEIVSTNNTTIQIKDKIILQYKEIANVIGSIGSNSFIIQNLTSMYDLYNLGETKYPSRFMQIVYPKDTLIVKTTANVKTTIGSNIITWVDTQSIEGVATVNDIVNVSGNDYKIISISANSATLESFVGNVNASNTIAIMDWKYLVTSTTMSFANGSGFAIDTQGNLGYRSVMRNEGDRIYVTPTLPKTYNNSLISIKKNINTSNVKIIR